MFKENLVLAKPPEMSLIVHWLFVHGEIPKIAENNLFNEETIEDEKTPECTDLHSNAQQQELEQDVREIKRV